MSQAIRIHGHGGPQVLSWDEIEVGAPGPGEVRLSQRACGLNFIDTYHRSGLYKLASFPAVIGMEGAGDITAIGAGVTHFQIGDRVAYAGVLGGYASDRLVLASVAMPLSRLSAKRTHEIELRQQLRIMRAAIDRSEERRVGKECA